MHVLKYPNIIRIFRNQNNYYKILRNDISSYTEIWMIFFLFALTIPVYCIPCWHGISVNIVGILMFKGV